MADEYKNHESKLISINDASLRLGIGKNILKYHIENGNIESIKGKISIDLIYEIEKQHSQYIGLIEFIQRFDSSKFEAKYSKHINKYIDYLEINNYFNIEIFSSNGLLFLIPEKDEYCIRREDIDLLSFKSQDFFMDYGLSEKEIIDNLLSKSNLDRITLLRLQEYIDIYIRNNERIRPSFTNFVRTISNIHNIDLLSHQDVIEMLDTIDTAEAKKHTVTFLNLLRETKQIQYGNILQKEKGYNSRTAYKYETFVELARIIFNIEYDKEHNLTRKALDNHTYAEMWLFLSIHYVCGWRASDICRDWVYPCLDNNNIYGINLPTLKEDILNGTIPESKYQKLSDYIITKIELSRREPKKTGDRAFGTLRAEVTPELKEHFGKLTLIAEYHNYISNDGYMRRERVPEYSNWVKCRSFFGEEIYSLIGKRNLSSSQLNKSFLQGIEFGARENGNSSLMAHMVAALARNHADITTTAIYLRDHTLTGEDAGTVLSMMMQRGVLSMYLYRILLEAFPDSFNMLSVKEQTELIKEIPITAFELETAGVGLIAGIREKEALIQGNVKGSTQILKAMYEIGNGHGRSKVNGVFCLKSALGYVCDYPTHDCIANLCPYHVFTSQGIPSLISIIKDYNDKYMDTGDSKYIEVLKQDIIPNFKQVLENLRDFMNYSDYQTVRKMIRESIDE